MPIISSNQQVKKQLQTNRILGPSLSDQQKFRLISSNLQMQQNNQPEPQLTYGSLQVQSPQQMLNCDGNKMDNNPVITAILSKDSAQQLQNHQMSQRSISNASFLNNNSIDMVNVRDRQR